MWKRQTAAPVFILWTLHQARAAIDGMKTFLYANQGQHPERHKYMDAVEGMGKLLDRMTLSTLPKQTTPLQHALTAEPAADPPPA